MFFTIKLNLHLNCVLMLNWIVWNRTIFIYCTYWQLNCVLLLNWIGWNRTDLTFISWLIVSYIEGYSISFQTFFVQAFKIVADSWKFSMLLLDILWDGWLIFMISASNEQLQQQLEYTLLKPDCHSWWISKMQSDTLEEQYAIKFCFKLGENVTGTYEMLQTAFGASCMNGAWVSVWHKRFKEGEESVRDDERCGRSKEVNTPELMGQRVSMLWARVSMLRF